MGIVVVRDNYLKEVITTMMKKTMWVSALCGVIVLGGTYTAVSASGTAEKSSEQAVTAAAAANTKLIGKAKAKQIALGAQAGRVDSVELEREHGAVYYEVEIKQGLEEYDVYIDAYTGTVLHVVNDDLDDKNRSQTTTAKEPVPSSSPSSTTAAATSVKVTTKEQAGTIAANYTNGTVVKVEKDVDDGQVIYEVDLTIDGGKAEVEIAASTGKVISVDKDYYGHDEEDDDWYDND